MPPPALKDDPKNEVVVRAWSQKGKAMIAAGVDAEWRGADARWVLLAAT